MHAKEVEQRIDKAKEKLGTEFGESVKTGKRRKRHATVSKVNALQSKTMERLEELKIKHGESKQLAAEYAKCELSPQTFGAQKLSLLEVDLD